MSPVGENVRKLRQQRDWDQEELAHRAKLAGSTVSKLENGRHSPRLDTVEALAEALGVSVADLVAASRRPALACAA